MMHAGKMMPRVLGGALLLVVILVLGTGAAEGHARAPGDVASLETVVLTAVADAAITPANPGRNFGDADTLWVENAPSPFIEACSLVRFDLASALPTSAAIDAARLELYMYGVTFGAPAPFTVSTSARFVTSPWGEMTVTWGTRPSTSAWQARTDVHFRIGWHRWNATGFARTWQANPASNHGVELCGDRYAAGYELLFCSREQPEPGDLKPRLVVTYHLTGPPPIRLPLVLRSGP
ncbi:MAG: DNRLRE domain-containing protein [Anaerolineae bacterium]